jgi:hydroxyquinol 1,2-dioxygenase
MDPHSLTDSVLASFDLGDTRRNQVISALIRHLHDFAREVSLSHAEWRAGLQFLTDAAAITDATRNEFSLISDVLGLSSLVDLMGSAPDATPGSVLGPFHVHGAPHCPNGADLQGAQPGQATLLQVELLSTTGTPIAAEVDFWQNAANGLYAQQDPEQPPHNLRCRVLTGPDGQLRLRTVLPQPYGIPGDGPVSQLMRLAGRSCMRPAHFHLIVAAPGHRTLVTELFLQGDRYLDTDAVFGVRPALIVPAVEVSDPAEAARQGMPCPFLRVACTLHLATTSSTSEPAPAP